MNEDELVAKIVAALKAEMTPTQTVQPATNQLEPEQTAVSDDVHLSEKLDHISQQIEEITLNEPSPEVKDNQPKDDEEPKEVEPKDEDLSDEEVEKMANILKL